MHIHHRSNPFAGMESAAAPVSARQMAASIFAETRSMTFPRRGDRRLLATLSEAMSRDLPRASTTVTLHTLRQVPRPVPSRLTFERMTGADRISLQSFVVRHPQATILIDPAVPRDVDAQAMAELQPILRTTVQPPETTVPTADALAELGIEPDIALCTHAHWDHVSGLLDLPGLPVALHDQELTWIGSGVRAPAGGVRRGLAARELFGFTLDGPPILSFERSHDLFGDGSVHLVDLAGHTPGSVGVLLATPDGHVLLIGDVAWHGLQIERLRQRSGFPGCLVDHDRRMTWRALHRLHVLPPEIQVLPAHDHERADPWRQAEVRHG